jgi:hypothetical protein
VFDFAARLRRPSVTRMSPALGAVGALGVQALTNAAFRTVQSAWLYASGTYLMRNAEPITVLGFALATIFAFGSARWRGVIAAVALFGAFWLEQFALSAPGRQTFCERSGSPCDWVAIYWPQLWPQLLGIALGLLALRAVRQGGPGVAALAIGVAVSTLSFSVGRLAFIPLLGPFPVGDAARGAINTVIGMQILGALAAGAVVGTFGRRHVLDAVILVLFFIGPWSPQLRVPDVFYGGFHIERDWQTVTPVVFALVALLGLAIGALQRRYRAVSVPTIP